MRLSERRRFVLHATIAYAIFATAWIFFSDKLLTAFTDPHQILKLSLLKGLLFVAITTIILFTALLNVPAERDINIPHEPNQKTHPLRLAVALSIPLLITLIQWGLWEDIRPYAWVLMYPAVFMSSWIGGLTGGLMATVICTTLTWYLFIPPYYSFAAKPPVSILSAGIFFGMGLIFSMTHERLRRTERQAADTKFRALVELSIAGIYIIQDYRFLYVNQAFANIFGYATPDEIMEGVTVDDLVTPADRNLVRYNIAQRIEGKKTDVQYQFNGRHRNGSEITLQVHGRYLSFEGNPAIIGFILDISEQKRTEQRLHQAAIVFETTHEGVLITDASKRILMVNRAFCDISGYSEEEVIGQLPSFLSSGRHTQAFYEVLWANLATAGHWQGEIWNRRKNGEIYPELLSISAVNDKNGNPINYIGVFADISQLKDSEAKLEHLAHHDPLTQLPNRLLFQSRLEHSIQLAQRSESRLALLMLDLDRFKDINDSYGHLYGDELLQQIAKRLTQLLRGVDTVARLGGDEFTVMMENISAPEDAAHVANEIISSLSVPCTLSNDVEVQVGVSIGISIYPDHGLSDKELLQHADTALYQAKASGRGRFMYFSEDLTRAARERIELELGLRRALAQNELRVYFQPQVEISSRKITGAEALVRWQHPTDGLIPPSRFIPVAEATGLINAISAWVLEQTCMQGKRWIDAGLPQLTLAVNLSSRDFLRGNLVELVSQTLVNTGFPAHHLELELTESILMERDDEVVPLLKDLRDLGIRLAIDDFGTGYSSLAYLKSFPLDVLKIDKSFVDDIPHHRDDTEIAATIVAMGHNLGFKVLAEGVERAEQLDFLQKLGCDSYQGYLTSQPLPADQFAEFLVSYAAIQKPN